MKVSVHFPPQFVDPVEGGRSVYYMYILLDTVALTASPAPPHCSSDMVSATAAE